VRFELVQTIRPEAAVAVEPPVDFGKWCWVEAVDAALGLAAARHEPRVAKYAEVARDSRLANRERIAQFAGTSFALAKHFDDLASGRVC